MVSSCWRSPAKIWLGFTVLLSAHHFVLYSKVVIKHLEEEAELAEQSARRNVGNAAGEFQSGDGLGFHVRKTSRFLRKRDKELGSWAEQAGKKSLLGGSRSLSG